MGGVTRQTTYIILRLTLWRGRRGGRKRPPRCLKAKLVSNQPLGQGVRTASKRNSTDNRGRGRGRGQLYSMLDVGPIKLSFQVRVSTEEELRG